MPGSEPRPPGRRLNVDADTEPSCTGLLRPHCAPWTVCALPHILLNEEMSPTPKTFHYYAAERDAALGTDGATAVRIFDAAYAVGAALAGARRARHLTQTQLASESGVSQADISRIERGHLTPTTPTLLRLIEAMHGQLALVVPGVENGVEAERPDQLVALSLV